MWRIPFTVFTKTCFSLLGSFSSSSTPWKMRPNVPVWKQTTGFYLKKRAGEREPEASHSKIKMSPHSVLTMPGWSVDRGGQASAQSALSLNGIRQFWLLSLWHEPKQEWFTGARRTFHHLERFRHTYEVERPSEHVHHLLCLNCHCTAPGLYWGKMPFKNINHQHKLRKNSVPQGQLGLVFQQERRWGITTGLVFNCLPPAEPVGTCSLPSREPHSEFNLFSQNWPPVSTVCCFLVVIAHLLIFMLHLLPFYKSGVCG